MYANIFFIKIEVNIFFTPILMIFFLALISYNSKKKKIAKNYRIFILFSQNLLKRMHKEFPSKSEQT